MLYLKIIEQNWVKSIELYFTWRDTALYFFKKLKPFYERTYIFIFTYSGYFKTDLSYTLKINKIFSFTVFFLTSSFLQIC